jgi:hypothetical protein
MDWLRMEWLECDLGTALDDNGTTFRAVDGVDRGDSTRRGLPLREENLPPAEETACGAL